MEMKGRKATGQKVIISQFAVISQGKPASYQKRAFYIYFPLEIVMDTHIKSGAFHCCAAPSLRTDNFFKIRLFLFIVILIFVQGIHQPYNPFFPACKLAVIPAGRIFIPFREVFHRFLQGRQRFDGRF